MGGFGSGRQDGAGCTDDYWLIDIRRWHRDGLISPGQQINWQWLRNGEQVASIGGKVETGQIRLSYSYQRHGEEKENLDYPVRLQTTACNYGGERFWFLCPAIGCGRRVAILYLGDKIFACRHCYHLSYQSQREAPDDRAHTKADKLRNKLGWTPGIANPNGKKPKGMHRKTFKKLSLEYTRNAVIAARGLMEKFERLERRLSF